MSLKLFKDVLVYRLTQPVKAFSQVNRDELNRVLGQRRSRQPASQEVGTFGFIEPAGEEDLFVEQIRGDSFLISAQQWKRDLPASVVNREVHAKVLRIEDEQQRKVYSKERRQIKDEVIMALLPRAFVKGKRVSAIVMNDFIFIDTSSAKLAESLLSYLRECIGSLPVRPVQLRTSPIATMTDILRTGETDHDTFSLGECFQAKGAHEESSTLSGKNVDLSEDDIKRLLDEGRQVTQLGLMWFDLGYPVHFSITEDSGLKGISWPEELAQEASNNVGEDADQVTSLRAIWLLIEDALCRLIADVLELLGGELLPDGAEDDFEKQMLKAAKDLAKNTRDYMVKNNASLQTNSAELDNSYAKSDALAALEKSDADELDELV